MSIWQLFKRWQTGSQQKKKKKKFSYILGDHFHVKLTKTSPRKKHKRRKPTSDSQAESLSYDISSDERYPLWIKLSRREQDVTALTCLKYTNSEIASRLDLSIETVRTYIEHAIHKLMLRNKADLRVLFAGWDFGAWERRKDPQR